MRKTKANIHPAIDFKSHRSSSTQTEENNIEKKIKKSLNYNPDTCFEIKSDIQKDQTTDI